MSDLAVIDEMTRLRISDETLDTQTANTAATLIAKRAATSVADAHLGNRATAGYRRHRRHHNDPRDMTAACSPTPVTIVTI